VATRTVLGNVLARRWRRGRAGAMTAARRQPDDHQGEKIRSRALPEFWNVEFIPIRLLDAGAGELFITPPGSGRQGPMASPFSKSSAPNCSN